MPKGDVTHLDVQRPKKCARSKAIRQKSVCFVRELECFVIATKIAHHATMSGANRRPQLGLLEGSILDLLQEVMRFLRGIAFAQVTTGIHQLPNITRLAKLTKVVVGLKPIVGIQYFLTGVPPALALQPYGLCLGKTFCTVQLAQNSHQLPEVRLIHEAINTVLFSQLAILLASDEFRITFALDSLCMEASHHGNVASLSRLPLNLPLLLKDFLMLGSSGDPGRLLNRREQKKL